jgi:hypothetical protein
VYILNEVLDNENIGEFGLDGVNDFDCNYTHLVTPGTHVFSDSEE